MLVQEKDKCFFQVLLSRCNSNVKCCNLVVWLGFLPTIGILDNGIGFQSIPLKMCQFFDILPNMDTLLIIGQGFNNLFFSYLFDNWIWERNIPN